MENFPVPTRDQVSASSQAQFDNLQKAVGFVPNLYATMAYSENGLAKYLAFQGAKTSLNNKEKEAVNLIVSELNGCRYCQSAHTALGKMNGFSDDEILKIRGGHASDARLAALVTLAQEVNEHKGHVTPATLDAFFAAGYDKGNLVDVILQVSDKIAMNYLHNLTKVPIDFPIAAELQLA